MKLDAYDVTIQLSDPKDKETKLKMVLEKVPREKVLTALAGLLELLRKHQRDNLRGEIWFAIG